MLSHLMLILFRHQVSNFHVKFMHLRYYATLGSVVQLPCFEQSSPVVKILVLNMYFFPIKTDDIPRYSYGSINQNVGLYFYSQITISIFS